jgi:hypothetical protein
VIVLSYFIFMYNTFLYNNHAELTKINLFSVAEPSRKGCKFNVDISEIISMISKGSLCNRRQDPGFETQVAFV